MRGFDKLEPEEVVSLILGSWVFGVVAGYAGGVPALAFAAVLLTTWIVIYVYVIRRHSGAK